MEHPIRIATEHQSSQNLRWAMELDDGETIETVLYRGDSLCISTQVGCAVGCPFCASGARGFQRNLSEAELREQVTIVRALHPVRRITASGIGEPLHNPALFDFVDWARSAGMPASVTTSGGPLSRLRRLLHESHNGLTISVHAGREETRARMVPRGPALSDLFQALRDEWPTVSKRKQKKTALAYLLVRDANDSEEELTAFASRLGALEGKPPRVHLYQLNPVPHSDHQPTDREHYERVYRLLVERGLKVHMSSQARVEANGGCGTLVTLSAPRSSFPKRARVPEEGSSP